MNMGWFGFTEQMVNLHFSFSGWSDILVCFRNITRFEACLQCKLKDQELWWVIVIKVWQICWKHINNFRTVTVSSFYLWFYSFKTLIKPHLHYHSWCFVENHLWWTTNQAIRQLEWRSLSVLMAWGTLTWEPLWSTNNEPSAQQPKLRQGTRTQGDRRGKGCRDQQGKKESVLKIIEMEFHHLDDVCNITSLC